MSEPFAEKDAAARIAEGRIKHGVGQSEDFPGNVSHLVSPIVGTLRLRERDTKPITLGDIGWFIDRLSLVLDMARAEAERDTRDIPLSGFRETVVFAQDTLFGGVA
jgi:hypothetical protein